MAQQVLTDLDFNSISKITNLPAPTSAGDAANKGYVDSAVEGLSWKDNVRVATSANINTSAPGSAIDGVTLTTNDRVLLMGQSTATQNGIYIFNGAATPLTRSLDANATGELEQAVVTVESGTNAGSTFRQTAINVVIGTTSIAWVPFGVVAPAATTSTPGIAAIATQSQVDTGTDNATIVTPLTLTSWAFRIKKFSQDIGDGSSTAYTVTHNLNSRDCRVDVYRNSGNFDSILVEVRRPTVNSVQIVFSSAPTTNQFRVVVIA
jgi:hypothetical protein